MGSSMGNRPVELKMPRLDGLCWSVELTPEGDQQRWGWKHYDLVHAQSRLAIKSDSALPAKAKQILMDGDLHARLTADGETIIGILPAFAHNEDDSADEIVFWYFAMVPDRLITGRRRPTRTLYEIWQKVEEGLAPRCPATFVDICIANFAHDVRKRLGSIGDELDAIEDAVINEPQSSHLVSLSGRLGLSRRAVTRLSRSVSPLARTLQSSTPRLPTWAQSAENDAAYRHIHEALDDIAALQERARSLQDELTSRFAEETNRRLYIVSIVTTLLMPAALVTGFFGMNTGGLPWSGESATLGTVFATISCVSAIVVTVAFLRWKKLL
jgi:zinc transporter